MSCFPLCCYPLRCLSIEENMRLGNQHTYQAGVAAGTTEIYGENVPHVVGSRGRKDYVQAIKYFQEAASRENPREREKQLDAKFKCGLLLVGLGYDTEAANSLGIAARKIRDLGIGYLKEASKAKHAKASKMVEKIETEKKAMQDKRISSIRAESNAKKAAQEYIPSRPRAELTDEEKDSVINLIKEQLQTRTGGGGNSEYPPLLTLHPIYDSN